MAMNVRQPDHFRKGTESPHGTTDDRRSSAASVGGDETHALLLARERQ
jgi:hypothetical protein